MLSGGNRRLAIEVKTLARQVTLEGIGLFQAHHARSRDLLVGPQGMPLDQFLSIEVPNLPG